MDSSSSPNGPATNSPSDVSYSSGVSRASTRSSSSSTSSHRSSPLLDLHQFAASTIESSTKTLPDLSSKMERNAFQSLNMRRDKQATDRGSENNTAGTTSSPFQRAFPVQQPQILRPSNSIGPQAPRSLTSNNWRTQNLSDNVYGPLESAGGVLASLTGRGPTSFPTNTQSRTEHHAALMSLPNMATFSDVQLESCYAYCFDRGNGHFTRLVPADMLPALQSVPAVQQGCHGMIVLPIPRAFPANGRSSNNEPIALRTPPVSPSIPADNIQVSLPIRQRLQFGKDTAYLGSDSPDSSTHFTATTRSTLLITTPVPYGYSPLDLCRAHIQNHPSAFSASRVADAVSFHSAQSRIDTIVATTPSTPPYHHSHQGSTGSPTNVNNHHQDGPSSCPTLTPGGGGGLHHHHHHAHHQQPQRRAKIYCDKWVHEGVCAFTQQGCKYKHEMPLDKNTQHQLGLFHGLPAWWKKHQAEVARLREMPQGTSSGGVLENDTTSGKYGGTSNTEGNNHGLLDDNKMERGFGGSDGRGNVGDLGGATSSLAWRPHGGRLLSKNGGIEQSQHNTAFVAGNSVTRDVVSRGSSTVWSPSPFGPIAPPPRAAAHATSPSRNESANRGSNFPLDNPYASLDALDTAKLGEPSEGARLA